MKSLTQYINESHKYEMLCFPVDDMMSFLQGRKEAEQFLNYEMGIDRQYTKRYDKILDTIDIIQKKCTKIYEYVFLNKHVLDKYIDAVGWEIDHDIDKIVDAIGVIDSIHEKYWLLYFTLETNPNSCIVFESRDEKFLKDLNDSLEVDGFTIGSWEIEKINRTI